jgi:amino acid transporter
VVSAVAAAVLVFALGYFGIRLSTGAGTLLGLFEILVFAALAVTLIFQAGDANTLAVFGTEFAGVEGFAGLSGVIAGSVYTILAFIGFEAAAPWPRRHGTRAAPSGWPSSTPASASACSTC